MTKGRRLTLLDDYAPILTDDYRYIGYWGGRGSGKSTNTARALILASLTRRMRILCCREYQASIQESVHQLLGEQIRDLGLEDDFDVQQRTIAARRSGSEFIFAGLRHSINSLKSINQIDIAWVEEAQTTSQRSLDLLLPTIRAPKSKFIFTWNPEKATDPVDVLLRSAPGGPPRSFVRRVNYLDNPWFPDVLKEQMAFDRQRRPDTFAHVWLGEYRTASEALVFRNWAVEGFEAPPDAEFRFGADFGFANDPTTLIRVHKDDKARKLYVDYEAWGLHVPIDRTPQLFAPIPGSNEWPLVADSARPETIDYLRRNGYPRIESAKKGKDSVKEGIEFIQTYDLIVHPRCKRLIDELGSYSYKTDRITGEVLPILSDEQNHCIDALRYALEAWRRGRYDWAAFS